MIKIFDTHTHLNVDNFAGKEQEEVDFAAELGVVILRVPSALRKNIHTNSIYLNFFSR